MSALLDPPIRAASFPGSEHGGRALYDLANGREDPIPFYAEMGSLNPFFCTPAALAARAGDIIDGFVASLTLGVGQFCTKTGLLFLPTGHGLEEQLVRAVSAWAAGRMLMDRIDEGHEAVRNDLTALPGMRVLAQGAMPSGQDRPAVATLLASDVPALLAARQRFLTACFGPTSIIAAARA